MITRILALAIGADFGVAANLSEDPANACALGLSAALCCVMAMGGLYRPPSDVQTSCEHGVEWDDASYCRACLRVSPSTTGLSGGG